MPDHVCRPILWNAVDNGFPETAILECAFGCGERRLYTLTAGAEFAKKAGLELCWRCGQWDPPNAHDCERSDYRKGWEFQ